ncbi:RimJ/RimL family protein N-acetyltransferase [Variovorax boronicumulans]|uniref:GNAT family N-acetyltransferase n=1 Tax=Variovorax boronicumulans TaxID=436515 RepID=UPI00278128A5|nr:GNAT family N-acetyltransferase [Variovorax boronicumulans]MDP9993678.1 RimJ/RimL family protein N-acetyltransferase [Variovorax boronicumulans]MDQ0004979.1 RimJ/RimL family protein N-acetyltransferase [Variovorax boronicumulans]
MTITAVSDSFSRTYPRTVTSSEGHIVLRLMNADDAAAVLAFAQGLPAHDLLFLPRDITEPKVMNAWVRAIERGDIDSVLAMRGAAVLGCAAVIRDPHSWSSHVAELRLLAASELRGSGLGHRLAREACALAIERGAEKLVARMTVDQRSAIAVFQALGFRPEALLSKHVKDRQGVTHDLVVLSHDVAQFEAQMRAYGMTEAF